MNSKATPKLQILENLSSPQKVDRALKNPLGNKTSHFKICYTKIVPKKGNILIAFAIIISALIVGAAVFFSDSGNEISKKTNFAGPLIPSEERFLPRLPDSTDHILGSPAAKIFIIEYADPECPYCKEMHPILHKLIDEFGRDGKVAWVYRQFPIVSTHSQALLEAEAIECAGEVGGEAGFWKYLDELYRITPSNNNLPLEKLDEISKAIGLSTNEFDLCRNDDRTLAKINDDLTDGLAAGVNGTPFFVLLGPNNQNVVIPGTKTYLAFKILINGLLGEN